MKYILASKAKCLQYEISIRHHIEKDGQVVLNEKEISCAPRLFVAETLEEKAVLLEGIIFDSPTDIKNYLNS